MVASFLIAESADNDAVRINLAGSLRMQSYKIAQAIIDPKSDRASNKGTSTLHMRINEFESRLYRPVLNQHIKHSQQPELVNILSELEVHWRMLKSDLLNGNIDTKHKLLKIDQFVISIEELVNNLELQTEGKFRLLRIIHGFSLLATIVIVVFGYLYINSNVVAPLKRLLSMTNKIRAGDFSQRVDINGNDELSLLAATLNDMSTSLDSMYRDLEQSVQEKTLHLEQARDGLSLLYETSRILSSEGPIIDRIKNSLRKVKQHNSFSNIAIQLTLDGEQAYCIPTNVQQTDHRVDKIYRFSITRHHQQHGELIIHQPTLLSVEHSELLQTIADNIAAAMHADWQQGQQHRLVLMEERAVIARELHDSLAQSLSYLKIQINRMQMLQARGDNPLELDNTVKHIKTGIDAAYRELRELLATFRLQLSNESLKDALAKTTAEFCERADIEINLCYELANLPLTANEEIHMLQIVRESLSNIIRHSAATQAMVSVTADINKRITMQITDNGRGFNSTDVGSNHYGKIIMQERASTLGGQIKFVNQQHGGALVELVFVPRVAHKSSSPQVQPHG